MQVITGHRPREKILKRWSVIVSLCALVTLSGLVYAAPGAAETPVSPVKGGMWRQAKRPAFPNRQARSLRRSRPGGPLQARPTCPAPAVRWASGKPSTHADRLGFPRAADTRLRIGDRPAVLR